MEPTTPPAAPQEPSPGSRAPDPYQPSTPSSPPSPPAPGPQPAPQPTPPTPPSPPPDPGISQTFTPKDRPSTPPPPFTVTVGDGGVATEPSKPVFTAVSPGAPASGPRLPFPRKVLIPLIAAAVLIIGGLVFYFGYYTNPSVIYGQALKNTGKGYDRLIDYTDKQSKLEAKGYNGAGSYQIKAADFSTDGKLGFKSNDKNSELTFDIGAAGTRVNADIRTIKSSVATPDIYFKAGGLKGLGTVMGMPDLDPEFAKLDDQWIVIDHTFIDQVNAASGQSDGDSTSPTREQVLDEARAFGRVNQQYVFTTSKSKAITKIVKKHGIENVDGHKAYHYEIALQKDHVKDYVLAQRDALKASKLNDWLKQNKHDKDVYDGLTDVANSAKNIKGGDTYDIWMDVSHRVVYKVRFKDKQNPLTNYVDVGLNYKGGDDYPFFISGKSQTDFSDCETCTKPGPTTTFSFITDVNTKTNNTAFKFKFHTDGSDSSTATADFNFKPNTSTVSITKPPDAIPIAQVLSELGLNDLFTPGSGGTASTDASGAEVIPLRNKPAATTPKTGVTTESLKSALLKQFLGG